MMRFVIACVVEAFYLAWRMDGIASTIVDIFMHGHVDFAMVGLCESLQVTMSRPGSSGHLYL